MSAEPSMEDILSSIKRIIAEEGDGNAARVKRPTRPPVPPTDHGAFGYDEILELSDPVRQTDAQSASAPPILHAAPAQPPREPSSPEPIVSMHTADASRGPLDALSRLIVRPEVAGSDTLEALVRELLRPMLRDWLDAHLPAMVETMVAREIERITGQAR